MTTTKPEVEITKVTPQFIPFKCPNCNGYTTIGYQQIPCKSCNQTGYIKVPIKEETRE